MMRSQCRRLTILAPLTAMQSRALFVPSRALLGKAEHDPYDSKNWSDVKQWRKGAQGDDEATTSSSSAAPLSSSSSSSSTHHHHTYRCESCGHPNGAGHIHPAYHTPYRAFGWRPVFFHRPMWASYGHFTFFSVMRTLLAIWLVWFVVFHLFGLLFGYPRHYRSYYGMPWYGAYPYGGYPHHHHIHAGYVYNPEHSRQAYNDNANNNSSNTWNDDKSTNSRQYSSDNTRQN